MVEGAGLAAFGRFGFFGFFAMTGFAFLLVGTVSGVVGCCFVSLLGGATGGVPLAVGIVVLVAALCFVGGAGVGMALVGTGSLGGGVVWVATGGALSVVAVLGLTPMRM